MAGMISWKPTIIVGIDFGMTCTAVAYSFAPEWAAPICIQRWPGQFYDSQLANKVTTQVSYDDNDNFVSWGFACHHITTPTSIANEFKLWLDPKFLDRFPGRPTHEQAVRWYKHFMSALWKFLDEFFDNTFPDWSQRNVEFLFSIPTTWNNPHLTAQLKGWLQDAGFPNDYKRKIVISQTEAEAAAVYAAKQSYQVGDKIMVADAGGATTDINILEIMERSHDRAQLKALDKAEGINVGSTLIDERVRALIRERLRTFNTQLTDDEVDWTADDMMKNKFEAIKCSYDGVNVQMDLRMNVPEEVMRAPATGRRPQVIVTAAELGEIFDDQLTEMFKMINLKLLDFNNLNPMDSVKYLVLSGGLGSSRYVQRRMKAQYSNMKVLCAPEPQLVVAKGLVMDRVQALNTGSGIYTGKCSRMSYGVLIRVPYDPIAHRGEPVREDPLDGKKWAENQIDWLVRESEAVPEKGFTRPYQHNIAKGEEDNYMEARLVMCPQRAQDLPPSLRGGDVKEICTIRAHFSGEEFNTQASGKGASPSAFKFKKGGFLNLSTSKGHYIAEVNLRVLVGSTDLQFALESKDGRRFDQNEASIEVEWHDAVVQPRKKKKSKKVPRALYPAAR